MQLLGADLLRQVDKARTAFDHAHHRHGGDDPGHPLRQSWQGAPWPILLAHRPVHSSRPSYRHHPLGEVDAVGDPHGSQDAKIGRSKAASVRTIKDLEPYDAVLSTTPIQYVPSVVLGLLTSFAARIRAIENIPIACVILKLKRSISDNFWMTSAIQESPFPA